LVTGSTPELTCYLFRYIARCFVVEVSVFAEVNMVEDMTVDIVVGRRCYEDHTVMIRAWYVERIVRSEKVQKAEVDVVLLP